MDDATQAKIDEASAFIAANLDRIEAALRGVLTDDAGNLRAPFVLLMPTTDGTQVISNLEKPEQLSVMNRCASSMIFEELKASGALDVIAAILSRTSGADEESKPTLQ